jgi:hypothetical protein
MRGLRGSVEDGGMLQAGDSSFAGGEMGVIWEPSDINGGVPSEFETEDLPSITDDLADFVKRITNNY